MAQPDFIVFSAIKKYIADKDMNSSDSAVRKIEHAVNAKIKDIVSDSILFSKQDRRKTVLDRDVEKSIIKNIGSVDLDWKEVLEEIIKQSPTELGKISQGIESHLRKE
ncbi:MAG: hypothetical protein ACOC56_00800 [Atribacterota bacterium]